MFRNEIEILILLVSYLVYKLKQAPEACQETIRQQPRTVPIFSEKHILTSNITAENEKLGNEILNKYKAKKAQMSQNNGMITKARTGLDSSDSKIRNFEKGEERSWDKGRYASLRFFLRTA